MQNFVWFQGVIEDRNDPLKIGRVKIRCYGYHTENKQDLPTEDLPWATPITPVTSASVNGIGETPLGPVTGTWVVGFFRDGSLAQNPVYFGTIPAISSMLPNPNIGFSDPSGVYPKEDFIDESDTNRLARNEKIEETIVEKKRNDIDEMEVPSGGGSSSQITEPTTPYNTQYPFNKVKETEGGHIQEFDDTPGAERIHWYHRSGTFEEIHPDGSTVLKVVGSKYEVTINDNNLHVRGNLNIDVDQNANILINGNANVKVDGKLDFVAEDGIDISTNGNLNLSGKTVNISGKPINLN